jgi:hypothetical protein
MPKRRVTLTMFQEPVEVDESEIPGLRAQGLVTGVEGETAAPPETDTTGAPDAKPDGGDAAASAVRKPRGGSA